MLGTSKAASDRGQGFGGAHPSSAEAFELFIAFLDAVHFPYYALGHTVQICFEPKLSDGCSLLLGLLLLGPVDNHSLSSSIHRSGHDFVLLCF